MTTISTVGSDITLTTPCLGVHANTTGIISGYLEGDDTASTARDFTIIAGMAYPLQFQKITAGGANVILLN